MKARMSRQLRRLRRSIIALAFVVGRWEGRIAARRRVRATVRALSVLDDRTLHDLGLGRSEVFSAALDSELIGGDHTARQRRRRRSPSTSQSQPMEQ
jgi:uncharacterized protein YjiS (DUF1127 family)